MSLKLLAAPKTWPVQRRQSKWIVHSRSSHKLVSSLPMSFILKYLGVAKTAIEAKKVILEGKVFIDGKPVKKYVAGAGLFDVVLIKGLENAYRVVFNNRSILSLIPISKEESNKKLVRVKGKRVLGKNIFQLNLHDGRSISYNKSDITIGDSLLISLPDQKILTHIKIKKGSIVFVTGGSHKGEVCKLVDFRAFEGSEEDRIVLQLGKETFETLESYCFVIGEDKELLKVR